jgi:hypothetical protein
MNYEFASRRAPEKPSSPAVEFVERLRMNSLFHKHAGKSVQMIYGGAFGNLRALRVAAAGHETLVITAIDDSGEQSEFVVHVSQCSIRFQERVLEKTEKPFIGFTPLQMKPE